MNYAGNTLFNKPHKTYEWAVKEFKKNLPLGEYDYWTIQLWWTEFVDGLCRSGKITQKQFDNWLCPFKYGKHVVVYDTKVVSQR